MLGVLLELWYGGWITGTTGGWLWGGVLLGIRMLGVLLRLWDGGCIIETTGGWLWGGVLLRIRMLGVLLGLWDDGGLLGLWVGDYGVVYYWGYWDGGWTTGTMGG